MTESEKKPLTELCVCVCERERERERGGVSVSIDYYNSGEDGLKSILKGSTC